MKQVMFIVTVACAHHEVPTFAETSIKPHPHFLIEWFYSIAGSVHVVIGGYILLSENGGLLIRVYVCGGFCRRTRSPHFPPHFPIHECTQTDKVGETDRRTFIVKGEFRVVD